MANKQGIKNRMKSVQSTMKITSAMELMATSKLSKQKSLMLANREYAEYLQDTVESIIARNTDTIENQYLKNQEDNLPITIVMTSDLGMCGGYNANIYRLMQEEVGKENPIVMLGLKGYQFAKTRGYNVVNEIIGSDEIDFLKLREYVNTAIKQYIDGEVTGIHVLYTEFVNAVTFEPRLIKLLPVVGEKDSGNLNVETIFEPNATTVLDQLIPMYLRSMVYSYFIEAKASEQAARRFAMEQATDNAEEILEKLELEYNRARQTAITQEITEIIAGADAI